MRSSRFALTAFAVAASLVASAPALAHAKLVRSTPAAQSVVASPTSISLTFSERVVPAFSTFELTMVGHDMKVPVTTRVSRDGKTISGTPEQRLMAGSYKITWTIASADGHRMRGEVPFRVS